MFAKIFSSLLSIYLSSLRVAAQRVVLYPFARECDARAGMPKRRREETEDAECSPLTDGALRAKILELVHKRGLTKTC